MTSSTSPPLDFLNVLKFPFRHVTPTIRFSGMNIVNTGRKTRNGKPLLTYELTNSVESIPLQAISYNGQVIAESHNIKVLSQALGSSLLLNTDILEKSLKAVIKDEGTEWSQDSRWTLKEDLSERKHLLEGSQAEVFALPDLKVKVCFSKLF